ELCLVGKPVVFIPSPNVAEDHQTKNAEALAAEDAAIVIAENQLGEKFKPVFKTLLASEERQKELADNIKRKAKPEASFDIADEVEKLLKPNDHECVEPHKKHLFSRYRRNRDECACAIFCAVGKNRGRL